MFTRGIKSCIVRHVCVVISLVLATLLLCDMCVLPVQVRAESEMSKTVHVNFDANGGNVYSSYVTSSTGEDYGFAFPTPDWSQNAAQDTYEFIGWFTEKEGGEEVTANSALVSSEDHTLYAHWKNIEAPQLAESEINRGEISKGELDKTIRVSFDSTGGSTLGLSTKAYTKDQNYGSLPLTRKNGYKFDGWYTSPVGGVKVTDTSKVSGEDVTLYAHWVKDNKNSSYTYNGYKFANTSVTTYKSDIKRANTIGSVSSGKNGYITVIPPQYNPGNIPKTMKIVGIIPLEGNVEVSYCSDPVSITSGLPVSFSYTAEGEGKFLVLIGYQVEDRAVGMNGYASTVIGSSLVAWCRTEVTVTEDKEIADEGAEREAVSKTEEIDSEETDLENSASSTITPETEENEDIQDQSNPDTETTVSISSNDKVSGEPPMDEINSESEPNTEGVNQTSHTETNENAKTEAPTTENSEKSADSNVGSNGNNISSDSACPPLPEVERISDNASNNHSSSQQDKQVDNSHTNYGESSYGENQPVTEYYQNNANDLVLELN